jgi:predicted ribosome-associated RNA-binding protein Tma20
MFKNDISLNQSHPLSKKEKKEIFKSLKNIFKEEYLNIMLSSFKDMSIHKGNIQNKKRNVIFEGSNPILFEYDKELYYPSIYLLQLFNAGIGENIIQNCALIYDATVEYIVNGADLMLNGVINRSDIKNSERTFKLGDLFYVQTNTGLICGVGTAMTDKKILDISKGGKFLRILHKIGDSLYNLGIKKELKPLIEQKKVEIMNKEDEKEENEEKNEINEEKKDEKKDEEKSDAQKDNNEIKTEENKNNIIINDIEENINKINLESNEKTGEEEEEKEEDEKVDKVENNLSKEEIDENLDIIFLTLCKLHLEKEKFPMDPGKLYHDFMKPLSEEIHREINIKLSSYKKVNEYFKYLSKEKNLIIFTKAKGQNNDYITKINFDNDIIKNFKPRISKLKFLSKNKNTENSPAENILLTSEKKIEIKTLYKPNQKLHNLFYKYIKDFEPNKHYDLKACKNVLISYLKEKNLFSNEVNKVKIDDYLKDLLKIKEDKFYEFGKDYDISEILEHFERQLKSKSCIVKISPDGEIEEEVIYSNVSIRIISKKINNKNVTLISGLEYFIDLKEATKSLAKHFATSVTIKDEIAGLKNAVFIQGHWVDELVEKLVSEFKINKKNIKVEDKLKNKKKK